MMEGGGVSLRLCGEPRRLRFDWNALGALRSKHGADFQDRINAAMVALDFDVIAEAISVAVGGALTPEAIKANPPAIVPALTALNAAFTAAYHGPDGPRPEGERGPLAAARKIVRAILSAMLSRLG